MSANRRPPPPCWTPPETESLIETYKQKWYSLQRGNLRANHWEQVAQTLASISPSPLPKTSLQCRHKMEKLRRRYRAEIQRSSSSRSPSPWSLFPNMHHMENPNPNPIPPDSDDSSESEGNGSYYYYNNNNNGTGTVASGGQRFINTSQTNYYKPSYVTSNGGGYGVGVGASRIGREGGREEVGEKRGRGVDEMVEAIEALGEGYMRIEKAKMDSAREIDEMRRGMELKRNEMIRESQRKIVEAFANAVAEGGRVEKKSKGMQPDE